MKKITSKIIVMLMAVMLILNLNTIVNATAEDMAVLENTDGDYLIYLNEYLIVYQKMVKLFTFVKNCNIIVP